MCTSRNAKTQLTIYFHQSIDGYPAFLDGLTVKMLKQEFGAYEKFPEVIRAPVLEVEDVLGHSRFQTSLSTLVTSPPWLDPCQLPT